MSDTIKTVSSSPESSNLNLIETLLKLNQASDSVFHQSMDIYITLIKTAGISGKLLRGAEALKNAVENFDEALAEEVKNQNKTIQEENCHGLHGLEQI